MGDNVLHHCLPHLSHLNLQEFFGELPPIFFRGYPTLYRGLTMIFLGPLAFSPKNTVGSLGAMGKLTPQGRHEVIGSSREAVCPSCWGDDFFNKKNQEIYVVTENRCEKKNHASGFLELITLNLAGLFETCLVSPLPGEMIRFDEHIIFQKQVETTN